MNLSFEGGARGNPSVPGAGAHIFFGLSLAGRLWRGTVFPGKEVTNNVAEYEALILGLQAVVELFGRRQFHFRIGGDSQLLLGQVTGEMACRAPNVQDPLDGALDLRNKLTSKGYHHVLMANTSWADRLANLSMDTKTGKKWLNPQLQDLSSVAQPVVPSQPPSLLAPSADPLPTPSGATLTSQA